MKKPIVALIYDFDGTLAPGNMQEFGFIQAIGKTKEEFWEKSNNLAVDQDASDVLSYMKEIPICIAYEIDGKKAEDFPDSCEELNRAKPIYEYLPGFCCDISGCHTFEELPSAAKNYIRTLEELVSCPIRYVSVGAERDACIRLF